MGFFQRFYIIKVSCKNCALVGVLRVPRGVTVKEHISGNGKCDNCGCSELQSDLVPSVKLCAACGKNERLDGSKLCMPCRKERILNRRENGRE